MREIRRKAPHERHPQQMHAEGAAGHGASTFVDQIPSSALPPPDDEPAYYGRVRRIVGNLTVGAVYGKTGTGHWSEHLPLPSDLLILLRRTGEDERQGKALRPDIPAADVMRALFGFCYAPGPADNWQDAALRLLDVFVDGLRRPPEA